MKTMPIKPIGMTLTTGKKAAEAVEPGHQEEQHQQQHQRNLGEYQTFATSRSTVPPTAM